RRVSLSSFFAAPVLDGRLGGGSTRSRTACPAPGIPWLCKGLAWWLKATSFSPEEGKRRVLAGSEELICFRKGHAARHGIPSLAPTAFSPFMGWPFRLRRSRRRAGVGSSGGG